MGNSNIDRAIKDKFHDMSSMNRAKSEAKEVERAEKELAKARVEVAHEIRLAKEAEASMDLHVQKAATIADEHERKHPAQEYYIGQPQDLAEGSRNPTTNLGS